MSRVISGSVWGPTQPISGSSAIDPSQAALSVGGEGSTALVWTERGEAGRPTVFVSCRSPSGVWSAPVRLSSEGSFGIRPDVAVTPDGGFIATWIESEGAGTTARVMGAVNSRATGQVARASLASGPGSTPADPSIALDTAGGAVVAFSRGAGRSSRIAGVRFNGRTRSLGGPLRLSPPSRPVRTLTAPLAVSDGDPGVFVLWQEQDGNRPFVARRLAGQRGAGPREPLSRATGWRFEQPLAAGTPMRGLLASFSTCLSPNSQAPDQCGVVVVTRGSE